MGESNMVDMRFGRMSGFSEGADDFRQYTDELERELTKSALGGLMKCLTGCKLTKKDPTMAGLNVLGRLKGEVLSSSQLDRLTKILKKNNAKLVTDADKLLDKFPNRPGAMFLPQGKKATIFIRKDATKYEVYHELKHWSDFKRLGADGLQEKGEAWAEKSVFEYMKKQGWMTLEEKEHAELYFNLNFRGR
jgi:hypothetical protein